METIIETEDAIASKTRELCETILAQPQFQDIRRRVDAFMADSDAQEQYERISVLGEQLHQKQHQGHRLSANEISAFDKLRETFTANPVAKGFMDAQEELHQLRQAITKQVSKTLELGHVPTQEDLNEGGGCGSGCGCHH